MKKVTRTSLGAVIALALALIAAAPAAAAQPTRAVYDLEAFQLEAGTACTFDVDAEPDWGFIAQTAFSDGSVQSSVRAHGRYVNAVTGATFTTADTFRELDRFDPATGIYVVTVNGQNTYNFAPGDQGPFGLVGPGPSMYHVTGAVSFTYDSVIGRYTQFSFAGGITDVCAALAKP